MAKAKAKVTSVTLVLSLDDAKALYAVQQHIGGSSEGPRGAFIRIREALAGAGLSLPSEKGKYAVYAAARGLYFGKEYKP